MKKSPAARVPVLCLATVALLASCATFQYAARPQNVMRVITEFNSGNTASLEGSTQLPFLFNGDIVELREDVATMWTNLVGSGLKIQNAQILENTPATPASYTAFADTMEVRVFFQKYLPKGTRLVRIGFDGGSFDLLLAGPKNGRPVIIGIKGGPT